MFRDRVRLYRTSAVWARAAVVVVMVVVAVVIRALVIGLILDG